MQSRHARVTTVLGDLTLVARSSYLTGLYFADHRRAPAPEVLGTRVVASEDELLARAARELTEYCDGARRTFDLPIRAAGDEFSARVWELLREIPYGATTTYGALAENLGNRNLAQRVGQAVGRNPLCVYIPCHRVIGADGSLTGYAGGIERKRWLLELEEPESERESRLF